MTHVSVTVIRQYELGSYGQIDDTRLQQRHAWVRGARIMMECANHNIDSNDVVVHRSVAHTLMVAHTGEWSTHNDVVHEK